MAAIITLIHYLPESAVIVLKVIPEGLKEDWSLVLLFSTFLFQIIAIINKSVSSNSSSMDVPLPNDQLEQKIKELEKEKSLLLKEIHHRVKNNLQVISSLLNLQSIYIQDPTAKQAVQAGQHRVKTMALIHQRLYQGENLTSIEMKAYLRDLCKSLWATLGISQHEVAYSCSMEELELDVDTAIPIGLIVNELVTNSLKFAFPEKTGGSICVILKEDRERSVMRLEVKDDGIGINKSLSAGGTHSFGSQLVELLCQQLGASLEIHGEHGTHTIMEFETESSQHP